MTTVFCTLSFEAIHCWPAAPEEVAFLRTPHRHMFWVKAFKPVSHDDRDVEFILLKRAISAFIETVKLNETTLTWSCEQWARRILEQFDLSRCEVSEDNENGAVVEK